MHVCISNERTVIMNSINPCVRDCKEHIQNSGALQHALRNTHPSHMRNELMEELQKARWSGC